MTGGRKHQHTSGRQRRWGDGGGDPHTFYGDTNGGITEGADEDQSKNYQNPEGENGAKSCAPTVGGFCGSLVLKHSNLKGLTRVLVWTPE